MIRLAAHADLEFLDKYDTIMTRDVLTDKINRGEVYVAGNGDQLTGFVCYNFFCDLVPFLTLIYVLEPFRRKGLGTQLMAYWERQMKEKGHRFLMTSTQADEYAQFFYRKLGYADSGSILLPGQAPTELVLLKQIRKDGQGVGPRQKK